MYETILFESVGGVATIALNRPQVPNAFNGQMHEELHRALDGAAADEGVRCVVLRGEGRAPGWIKQTLHASFESDLETILEGEAQGQTLCGYTRDHREGVAAFFEKREPNFTGR